MLGASGAAGHHRFSGFGALTPSGAPANACDFFPTSIPVPTIEIDGRKVDVPDGTTVIQAADRVGVEIPHYCWHPGLPIAGNCRMCLVEIEKMPKLQIACNTRVTDGMVVHTTSEKTKTAQKAVLEFLLINHPIDCPVCDQAGECKLQEYYMDYDRQRSRFPLPEKNRKRKAIPIGPLVMLDQERCILCARCTRFLDEVTHTSELGIYQRGDHDIPARRAPSCRATWRRRNISSFGACAETTIPIDAPPCAAARSRSRPDAASSAVPQVVGRNSSSPRTSGRTSRPSVWSPR